MNVTAATLIEILAIPAARAQARIGSILAAIEYAELNTPLRLAHYLGQVGHETYRFKFTREIWGPTAAQKRYERNFNEPWPSTPSQAKMPVYKANRLAFTLGNVAAGDGLRFLGRGDLQTTGRGNYKRLTQRLKQKIEDCPNFEAMPAALEQAPWVSLAAADYWVMRNLNVWADANDIYELTCRVNGGTNGLADRQAIFTAAFAVLSKE